MEKKGLHLIFAVPATQEETEGEHTDEAKENEINPSEVLGLWSKFLSSYYECGAERKYKNSADYVLSMYAVCIIARTHLHTHTHAHAHLLIQHRAYYTRSCRWMCRFG